MFRYEKWGNKPLLILLLFVTVHLKAFSVVYYMNSNIGSDTNIGSEASPWKTLISLEKIVFKPGDKVLFERNSNFSGVLTVNGSGSTEFPITISAYGSGPGPVFTNPDFNNLNGNIIQVYASYVVINDLKFRHSASCTLKDPVKAEDYWSNKDLRTRIDTKVLQAGAVYQSSQSKCLKILHCEFEDCPIAINLNGQQNLVDSNVIHDCGRFLWEPLWGPIGILIASSNNEISNNKCLNYKIEGGTFGADGGFIELDSRYNGCDIRNVSIHHNFSQANEGFIEITNSGKNLNISYNVSDDYQQFVFFWAGDSSLIANNTVIRTRLANSGVNVVFTFKNSGYIIKNNIFILSDSLQVFAGGAYDARNFNQLHENNLYHRLSANTYDPVGQPLGKGEIITDPHFRDYEKSDFRLRPHSKAIDVGQNLGFKTDFLHNPVPSGKGVDIGAFEF